MTRKAFDLWIEQHYGELVAVARRLVNNPEDATEVVHDAVAASVGNGNLSKVRAPWTWMVNAVRGKAKDRRVSDTRRSVAMAGFASALYLAREEENG